MKEPWQINTEKLADEIKEIARRAQTEEDLKMAVEPLLQNAFKKIGVDIESVGYERTSTALKGKRTDAVYGYLLIEYKVPGKLSSKPGIKAVSEQIEHYLAGQAVQVGQ